jgi:1-deoxy-D-xylulose-5-phosphate reductoisomerase
MALSMPPPDAPRRVAILGSTGSVGCSTVDLIARHPGRFVVEALTARANVAKLAEQAVLLKAGRAVIADAAQYAALREALSGTGIAVAAGEEAVVEAASIPAEWVMSAIVGAAGLEPTLAAVRRGAIVALANKECLVCAGKLLMAEVRKHGATLLPVDSEHSAIFQVFDFVQAEQVEKIILTASGGPFRTLSLGAMQRVTPEAAVAHPNWSMGAKISVDSATMMNKGLELIEAYHLFPVRTDQIEIVVHPQSIVHSLVCYQDGSVLAQLGTPDMRTPISYALGWPRRMPAPAQRLDLVQLGKLTFEAPDIERFPALRLAREALHQGGGAPTILNAVNEVAVAGFLAGEIGFLDIARSVEHALGVMPAPPPESLADVRALDAEARRVAAEYVKSHAARV